MATRHLYEDQTQTVVWGSQAQERFSSGAPARMSRRMIPTPQQRQRAMTGFVLSIFSLFAAFFPICGLPIAIIALLMELSSRRVLALRTLATWGLAFSIIALLLTFVNICIYMGIYFSHSLLR